MIENKLITITKDNQFDKGWTLFSPFDLGVSNNRSYRDTMISDVVRLITHSDTVNLILCEECLSSRIVNEIEWANKYINLNVIVKSESILKRYSGFHFTSKTVDQTIDFNYIGVHGKESGFYMINDGFVEIDESVDRVYFQDGNCNRDYSFLKTVKTVVIVDKDGTTDYSELINEAKKAGVECHYTVNAACYNRKHFDFAKNNSLSLLVSEQTSDGILLVHRDLSLSCLVIGTKGFFILYPIEKKTTLLGSEYKCGFYADTVDTKSLQGEIYSCNNGTIKKLEIAEKRTVSIDVPVQEMADFVTERFDASITEKHNRYSAEAKKVEYRFTLIPPLFDESYSESKLYEPLHNLLKKWNALQKLDIKKIEEDYNSILEEDFGLASFLAQTIPVSERLSKAIKKCTYKGFYSWLKEISDIYRYMNDTLLDNCVSIFRAVNKVSSGTKFDKFDNEIAGYEQTIKEKTKLIEQGIDVLSNKRRVEILTNKIAELKALKQRFETTSDTRNDKSLSAFVAHCNELLSNTHQRGVNDSIGTIVKPKEETKTARLEAFVDAYLYPIKKYVEDCLSILEKIQSVRIPEDYPVFEKDGARFIVINKLAEFKATQSLCNEFNMKCLARR